MDLLRTAAEPLQDALPAIGRKSFPGMSADEADVFELGFWAGAMAHALATTEGTISADELAERIEAEIKRIVLDRDEVS
ncbi:MAG TPA: hypothetical protein VEW95_02235 [Candidatus Limnocylindrales bacterium]|nr:hypothetical protein [Candidatus Limnocylindrales bacterium]